MFRRSFRVSRGSKRSINRLWRVYIVNTKCQHAQYTSHWTVMAPLLRHISEFDVFVPYIDSCVFGDVWSFVVIPMRARV